MFELKLGGWTESTLTSNYPAHGTLPGNNTSLSRTMVATFMNSTYIMEDMTVDSPVMLVEFREESIDVGNTVVLYLYGEIEIEMKEAALVIMNKACMLPGAS